MGKYIHRFQSKEARDNQKLNNYEEPWVSAYIGDEFITFDGVDSSQKHYFMGQYTCENEEGGPAKTGYIWDYDAGNEGYHVCAISESRYPAHLEIVYDAHRIYDSSTGTWLNEYTYTLEGGYYVDEYISELSVDYNKTSPDLEYIIDYGVKYYFVGQFTCQDTNDDRPDATGYVWYNEDQGSGLLTTESLCSNPRYPADGDWSLVVNRYDGVFYYDSTAYEQISGYGKELAPDGNSGSGSGGEE